LQYISSIRPQAEIYGICKIIPPESWAPPLALDKNSFKFTTVIQAVHRLQDRLCLPAQQAFYEDLKSVMSQEGKAPKKPPSFGGREVDLYKMYRAVGKRGGYAAVTDDKRWKDIVRVLQVCTGLVC
jgi:histone demethylase JARID1